MIFQPRHPKKISLILQTTLDERGFIFLTQWFQFKHLNRPLRSSNSSVLVSEYPLSSFLGWRSIRRGSKAEAWGVPACAPHCRATLRCGAALWGDYPQINPPDTCHVRVFTPQHEYVRHHFSSFTIFRMICNTCIRIFY